MRVSEFSAQNESPLMPGTRTIAARLRHHGGNAVWSAAEYVVFPLLLLLATPFLLRMLGDEQFGRWMLVNALASLGPVAGLGMAPAAIRYVASHLARGERAAAVRVVRTGLAVSLAAAAVTAGVLAATGPFLATAVFARMGEAGAVAGALAFAGAMIVVQQVDVMFSAALKGAERFRLVAPVEAFNKLLLVGASVAAAAWTGELFVVLCANLAVTAFGALTKAATASRVFGREIWWPAWFPGTFRELRSFGLWSWVQGLSGALFQSIDRLLIGALAGAAPLAVYSICLQLAQQVHALPSAGMSILMPLASRQSTAEDGGRFGRLRSASIVVNVLAVSLLAGCLALGGHWILSIWMGEDFARANVTLLYWLVAAYFLLALNIAPHYLLLGQGRAGLVSASNLAGGILGAVAAALLIPPLGLVGAAMSRMLYGPAIMINFVALFRQREPR